MEREIRAAMRIPGTRLDRQLISRPRVDHGAQVVAWFGAMQAQDYLAGLWAMGLRTPGATEAAVEAVLADGAVVRTHLFRGTWQLVAREDVRWMLDLMGPRVIASWASGFRKVGLDDRTLGRCGELLAGALAGGARLTRQELAATLERGRIPRARDRLSYILGHAELAGVICGAGRRGKQVTWALLDHRLPTDRDRTREAALAELAVRYFQSRGPATVADFAWWTGLSLGGAREALELAKGSLASERVGAATYWLVPDAAASRPSKRAHLLPAFDEYLVGYQDRSAVVPERHARQVNAGGGMLNPAVVVGGRVVGTWQRRFERGRVAVALQPFGRLTAPARDAVVAAAKRYGAFLGSPVVTAANPSRRTAGPGS
jgi:hypothetical protein